MSHTAVSAKCLTKPLVNQPSPLLTLAFDSDNLGRAIYFLRYETERTIFPFVQALFCPILYVAFGKYGIDNQYLAASVFLFELLTETLSAKRHRTKLVNAGKRLVWSIYNIFTGAETANEKQD